MIKTYTVSRINTDIADFSAERYWENIHSLQIEDYLWADNGYKPRVIVKLMYSADNLYLYFKVYEKNIRIKHTQYGSEVWKDSCVEFFINPFPQKTSDYINIEMNALGVMLAGKGRNRNNRAPFLAEDVQNFKIISSIKQPVSGNHGAEYWKIYLKIPITFFERAYNETFSATKASANFYKCGDETEFIHYGMWNRLPGAQPDFHQPRYFGELLFEQI